jgi:hypothetical protein
MRHARCFAALALLLATAWGVALAQDVRNPGESDLAFAGRTLNLPADSDTHVTATAWNGVPTLFVDYKTQEADPQRPLVALQPLPSGAYRTIQVTMGEQEGGTPDIAALGFARAEKTPGQDLIVILSWEQEHYDVDGTLYEVRIFREPAPGQTTLTPLKVSDHFGTECDCNWRDGRRKRFRYKTIAAVKAELKRMGF